MRPKNPTALDTVRSPVAELIGMTGMSQAETADFLTAIGIPTSVYSVKSWTRSSGSYNPPMPAITALWNLIKAMWDDQNEFPMPPEAPDSVLHRRMTIVGMQILDAEEWERTGDLEAAEEED